MMLVQDLLHNIRTPQIPMPLPTAKSSRRSLMFALLCQLAVSMASFGMNKPHHLFHLGDRAPISLNLGWGYWAADSPNRFAYLTTDDGIYASMDVHDGSSLFSQTVEDRSYHITSNIKYMTYHEQGSEYDWQAEIKMENLGSKPMTWYTYVSVENNDYRYVDHDGYSSFIFLKLKLQEEHKAAINCESKAVPPQKITVFSHKSDVNVFGLTANTSETFAIKDITEEFKHLVQLHKGQDVERTGDNATLVWENRQLNMMKENKWEKNSYIVMFVYGIVQAGQTGSILLTNSTSKSAQQQFRTEIFDSRHQQISKRYELQDQQLGKFVKHVVSNLYGGITFYFGRLYTQNSLTVHSQDYSYTFTPSRRIFPRSFLWDDGFHQSVVVHYDANLVMDMLQNWMNKVDIFGWIGREQIRGGDITSMMPDSRFVFQDWFQMNPPTLLLPILTLIDKSSHDSNVNARLLRLLKANYRKLEQWYRYFKATQSHQSLEYEELMEEDTKFYRWQCKDQCSKGNFMGSGLDDYPRMNAPHQISKQHVDLLSWLYFFSSSLDTIGTYLEKQGAGDNINLNRRRTFYQKEQKIYLKQIYEHMYDESDGLFKDIAVHQSDLFVEEFVDVVGYINLFPFMTGMLRQGAEVSEEKRLRSLRSCLEIMMDEKSLMSEDGLRSLSISDKHYGTEENYWRGAVWMPINYMVLRACKLYYWDDAEVGSQVRALYETLRNNLITSVHRNYKESGYLFENYYEGKGHRGFPFYGWTSLITNIITQKY